jgi:hypothetical protein
MLPNKIAEIITEISIYSVLIPITFGIKGFKSNPFILKAFLLFLCYGGAVDIATDFIFVPTVFFNSYTSIQVLFFTWFLYMSFNQKKLFKPYLILMTFWILLFLFCHIILLNDWKINKLSSIFDTMAAIITSFVAAAALVSLVKDELELTKNPVFWFCLAIFFYTFCTYFIFSFVSNPTYREKLWWIHNLANIAAYMLYTYGYWVAIKNAKSK